MSEDKKYWFQLRTGGALLGFAHWLPKNCFGTLVCIGIMVYWIGGPYLFFELSDEIGRVPGIIVTSIALFLLLYSAFWKTERIEHD